MIVDRASTTRKSRLSVYNQLTGNRMKNLGCQFGQGYLLAKPLDVQEIESMLVNVNV